MKGYTSLECTCEECGKETYTKVIDEGIGVTEAWGVRKRDVRLVVVSSCCQAGALDNDGNYLSMSDVEKIYPDMR